MVLKEIKQCQEAIDTAPAGREDVIQENTARIAVYQEFAPRMMGREEIAAVVDQVLAELNLSRAHGQGKGPDYENPDAPGQGQGGQRPGQPGADQPPAVR